MKKFLYILPFLIASGCNRQDEIVSLVKFNDKYGFIDTKGNWYIKPNYDSLGIFYNGYANCYYKDKVGIIDFKGRQLVDYKYDFIGNIEDDHALIVNNDSINYIDLNGNLISKIYFNDGEDFSCGLAPVQLTDDGKWGYINTIGTFVIDAIFDYAGEFRNDKAIVSAGVFDYFINKNGKIMDTIKNQHLSKNFPLIGNSNSLTLGRLNNQGDTIMKMNYKSFGYLQGDKFWFNTGHNYGLADTTGKIICKSNFEYLSYFADNGLALAKLGGKYGYIKKDCSVIIKFEFQEAQGFKYHLAAAKNNGKWGFINERGEYVIKPKYESVGHQFRPVKAKFESMYNYESN